MNLSRIKAGDTIKNYKTLCSILEVEPKTGRAKQNQLKALMEAIEFEQEGHKFIIKKILSDRVVIKRNRRNTSRHVTFMKLLLLNILKNGKDDTQYYSMTALATALKLIGDRYTELFSPKRRELIAEGLDTSKDYVDDFFNSSTPAYKKAINTILTQLEKDNAIFFNTVTMITYEDSYGEGEISSPATRQEMKQILQIQKECMKPYGKTKKEIYDNNASEQYYSALKTRLKEDMGIIYHYKAFEIQGLEESLQDEYDYLLQEEGINPQEIENMKVYLEQRIYEEWHKSSMKRFSRRKINAKNKSSFGEAKEAYRTRVSDDYEKEMEMLYQIFIRDKQITA